MAIIAPSEADQYLGLQYLERRKRSTIADLAVARELTGWCCSLAVMPDA
jgi:hypothetical protein